MDISSLSKITKSKWYWPVAACVSLAAGVLVGLAVDKAVSSEEQNSKKKDMKPVVVDEKSSLEVPEVSSAFKKPNISEVVDYTKFYGNGNEKAETTDKSQGNSDSDGDVSASSYSMFEIISEDEFVASIGNDDGYVTATGTFFPESRVLAGWNEQEEPKDVATTIGEEAVTLFENEDVKAVYVRNVHLKVLYEVVRGEGLYTGSQE